MKRYENFVNDLARFDRPIFRCNVCGMQFIHPSYNSNDLLALYDHQGYQAFLEHSGGCIDFDGPEIQMALSVWHDQFVSLGVRAWKEGFNRIHTRKPRFLDVGCGKGRNLILFERMGFEVSGFDLAQENVRFVTEELGFEAQLSSWGDLKGDRILDCILASNIIEHVDDPRTFLNRLGSVLSEGGMLIVETPRTDDWGDEHDRYRDIYHTLFFDTFTLTLLGMTCGLATVNAQNITFRRNDRASNQVNIQLLFEKDQAPRTTTLDKSAVTAFRRCFDSLDSDFLSLVRYEMDRRYGGGLIELGISHLRERGFASTLKYTYLWTVRELAKWLKSKRKAVSL